MKKRKSYDPVMAMRKAAVGIQITWQDETPMEDNTHIVNGKVGHRNPMLRPMALKLWASSFGKRMVESISARWQVRIEGIFEYENGVQQIEERELEATCILNNLNEHALAQIKEIMRYGGGRYITTRFTVTCLGIN